MATLCGSGARPLRGARKRVPPCSVLHRVAHTQRGPVLLSRLYVPTLPDERVASPETIPSLRRLLRGGYVRQSASGTFSYLPLGLRMLDKISAIIDEELEQIGASRLEMPQLLSPAAWYKSGRIEAMGSELYRFKDRRGAEMILGPTHEEEVTRLIGADLSSPKQLPVRVYQITRKFRDEPRPRAGLLRTKEFLMKDLYSFDANEEAAQKAYSAVRQAYVNIFQRIFDWGQLKAMHGQRVWREAEADTGAMGGSFSHEYHVEDAAGEDTLLSCNSCGYAANSECAKSHPADGRAPTGATDLAADLYLQPASEADRPQTLVAAVRPAWRRLKDTAMPPRASPLAEQALSAPLANHMSMSVLVDPMCGTMSPAEIKAAVQASTHASPLTAEVSVPDSHTAASLCLAEEGDACPECSDGRLSEQRAIEVGHTFLLGTRYSEPLGCTVPGTTPGAGRKPVQMGCYGIGITRILGALAQRAASLFDDAQGAASTKGKRAGFFWPASVAPFEALVIPAGQLTPEKQRAVDQLCVVLHDGVVPKWSEAAPPGPTELHAAPGQVALDDRTEQSLGSRLYDADLVGYPMVFVLGKHWERTGEVEVRRAGQPTSYAVIDGVALQASAAS